MSSYRHVPHPHIARRKAARPVKVALQIQEHLISQDRELERLINRLDSPPGQ
jgi:hypothetical protein